MTYLIGDIGNTETKIYILNKNFKIIKRLKINTLKISNQNFLNFFFSHLPKQDIIFDKALFSSVVPSVFLIIKKYIKKKFNIQSQEIKNVNYSKIIKIKVNKKQIGSDRIANAIGAFIKYKSNCIIVDFGTATTFDVLYKGIYLGGVIAPGVSLSLTTLVKKADQLPKFTLKKINKVIGKNTISALRSGFYWGYVGLIENILNLIKKETKNNYKIIFTGGFSSLFNKSTKLKISIDKDITMIGLIELLKKKLI